MCSFLMIFRSQDNLSHWHPYHLPNYNFRQIHCRDSLCPEHET